MKSLISDLADSGERTEETQRVGQSLSALLNACGYTDKIQEQRAAALFYEILELRCGSDAVSATEVKQIEDGQLQVVVSKPAWRHRLTFEIPQLIELLNKRLGADTVGSIRLG